METRTIHADQQQLNEQQEQAARELIETISMQVANQPPENIKEALVVDGSRCLVLYTDGTYMELQLIHASELDDTLSKTNILGSVTLQ